MLQYYWKWRLVHWFISLFSFPGDIIKIFLQYFIHSLIFYPGMFDYSRALHQRLSLAHSLCNVCTGAPLCWSWTAFHFSLLLLHGPSCPLPPHLHHLPVWLLPVLPGNDQGCTGSSCTGCPHLPHGSHHLTEKDGVGDGSSGTDWKACPDWSETGDEEGWKDITVLCVWILHRGDDIGCMLIIIWKNIFNEKISSLKWPVDWSYPVPRVSSPWSMMPCLTFMWRVRFPFRVNLLGQYRHLKGLLSECKCMWPIRLCILLNSFPHSWKENITICTAENEYNWNFIDISNNAVISSLYI